MHGKQPSGLLTQKKMLHSAISLFLEKGYEKATTAEIARGAGMTPSAFFRAYPSKEALLLELVKQMFDNQFAEAERRTGEMDQLMMYAVETALQMHLAELSESMRDLYVTAYSLPSTAAYIYREYGKAPPDHLLSLPPVASGKGFLRAGILPPAASRAATWPCRAISISRLNRI
jgi:Transcriptional regulator